MSEKTPTMNGLARDVRARDTAVPSSPKTPPQLAEMKDSVLVGIPRAEMPSELRLGM